MIKIQVRGANGYVVDFSLDKSVVSLGRDPESDVFLPSQQASRNHARVFIKGGDVFVEDLGSSNGTFLRSEKLKIPTKITEEDPVKLGDVYIRVTYVPDAVENAQTGEYSVAQRLGNRKETTHLNAEESIKLRRMLAGETGPFKAVTSDGPFKTKK